MLRDVASLGARHQRMRAKMPHWRSAKPTRPSCR